MFSRLRSDIQCILDRDPAARSTWEVITCYPGLHAVVMHRFAHWLWTHGLKWLGRVLYPEAFPEDLRAETRSFYSLFYNRAPDERQLNELLRSTRRTSNEASYRPTRQARRSSR